MARVLFDPDDIDAAFEELETRYLAGEAARSRAHMDGHYEVQAAYNRHEVPPTTADCVNIDHRPGIAFAPGDATAYIGATYDVAPNVKGHLESCASAGQPWGGRHRSGCMGPHTRASTFEWREVALFAFEGDMVTRLRDLRRGGPRRRPRPLRGTSVTDTTARKCGKPSSCAPQGVVSRPVTGTRYTEILADDIASTIAVGP